MNKKYTVKDSFDLSSFFIISEEKDKKEQLEKVFSIQKGYGFCIDYTETDIRIVDYFHGETRASFKILYIEDTDEEVCYVRQKL